MPIANTGVSPSGGIYNELMSVTRRAFIPKLIVQIYFASPTLYHLFGTAQMAAGGLNQLTIPMQGQSAVQGQFTGYSGGFNSPQIIPAVQNGQWNLAYWVVPVPLPFGETILQQSAETVIPLLKVRMNDVFSVTWQSMARNLFNSNASNPLYPNALPDAFDNGTNVPIYGGINRLAAGNSAFQGNYINLGAAPWNLSAGFTRTSMSSFLLYITAKAGGEAPTFVVMNPGDFATLSANVQGTESQYVIPSGNYDINSNARTAFPNLNVGGIPIFADTFCPIGQIFAVNTKYSTYYIDQSAALDFSGFYSLVPLGQIAQQGVVVLGYNFISAKSSSGAYGYNLGGAAFTVQA